MPDQYPRPGGSLNDRGIRIKIAAVAVGLLIFLIAAYVGWSSISHTKGGNEVQEALDSFSIAFLTYEKANPDGRAVSGVFDAGKLSVLSSEDIENDLAPRYDLTIEISDVSQYAHRYSFTLANDTAWAIGNPDNAPTVRHKEVPCSIVIGPSEVHPGIVRITMGG
jgi:hypothetical protein